jgi:Asp-tRNA(Asn)/Glu-tRNA(Gln) amidotransferase A subunit family amidase
VVQLKEQLASGKITSEEIVLGCISSLRTKGVELNAIFEDLFEEALGTARRCDEATREGKSFGRLHGIPFSVKDHIRVKGTATCWGLAA